MILVVGSLNADLVVPVERLPAPGETVLGGDHARHRGGKGGNQAVAAARAGSSVRMLGRVGDDTLGAWLREGLVEDGIDDGFLTALPSVPSGVALIGVDAQAQNAIIVSPGANGRLTPADLTGAAFVQADLVLLQLEVPLPVVLAAASRGREAGATVVLNLAPAQVLTPAQLRDVDVLITNESEAAALLQRNLAQVSADPVAAARSLTDLAPAAIVTAGAAGAAWALREEGEEMVPGFPVPAIDTTAAGDAFVGAFAAALAAGSPLPQAVRVGNAAGALAVGRPGAQPSLPHRDKIDAFLNDPLRHGSAAPERSTGR